MTLAELYVRRPEQVWDEDGDPWTLAEDGLYALGTAIRKHGQKTLSFIQRHYGVFFCA